MGFKIAYSILEKYTEDSDVTEIVIPDSVTIIGEFAFGDCKKLTKVIIPDSVMKIGNCAFYDCENLTEIMIPKSVKWIGCDAFYGTQWLTLQQTKNNLVIINDILVKGVKHSGAVTIPDNVVTISRKAFCGCADITQIIVSNNNQKYCSIDGVLYTKDKKTLVCCPQGKDAVTIPKDVTKIGEFAFDWCSNLTQVIIPSGIIRIEGSAFNHCSNLTNIEIPDSVSFIGESAFSGCMSLRSVTIPNNVTKINGYTFNGCRKLTKIIIGDGVKIIGEGAFRSCTNLINITIPYNVETIGINAFKYCENLKVIKLHPDDPEIYRDYGSCTASVVTALKMIRTGNYKMSLNTTVKYPFLILHYLHTKDEAIIAYIKKNIAKMMKASISAGDFVFIQFVTQTDTFITQKSIDKYIQQALDEQQQKIWAYLADYKHKHFGFESKNDGLL